MKRNRTTPTPAPKPEEGVAMPSVPGVIAGVVVGSNRMLRMKELELEVGFCRATIYAMIAAGTFPRGRRIGARSVAWPASEVEHWKSTRPLA